MNSKQATTLTVTALIVAFLCMGAFMDAKPTESRREKEAEKLVDMKMDDLVKTGLWEHNDSDGITFYQRIAIVQGLTPDSPLKHAIEAFFGGVDSGFGEILAKNSDCNVDEAIAEWRLSTTHNAILTDPMYSGYVQGIRASAPVWRGDKAYGEQVCFIVRVYYK